MEEQRQRAAKQPRLSESTDAATVVDSTRAGASGAQQSYEVREAVQRRRVGRPEGWSESQKRRPYLPVGALVCAARQVQTIRKALEGLDWLKHSPRNIHACVPARQAPCSLSVSLCLCLCSLSLCVAVSLCLCASVPLCLSRPLLSAGLRPLASQRTLI